MIVAVCSLSGAPGVTTLATALTAVWPTGPLTVPVMVETDVSGGDLAAWHRLTGRPGAVALAASTRTAAGLAAVSEDSGDTRPLIRHATELPGGLRVLLAPPTAHEAAAVVTALAQRPQVLAGGLAVLDVGRVMPGTAGAHLLTVADAVVLAVSGRDAAQIHRVARCRDVLDALTDQGVQVGLAVQASRFPESQIEEATGYPVWGMVPEDTTGAAFLRGEGADPRTWREHLSAWSHTRQDPEAVEWMPLLATARRMADHIDDQVADTATVRSYLRGARAA